MSNTKSMHIPLPTQWHEKLTQLAKENKTSATELVRNAIAQFLKEQERKNVHSAIVSFAQEYAGTEFDLDYELEEASLESLRKV